MTAELRTSDTKHCTSCGVRLEPGWKFTLCGRSGPCHLQNEPAPVAQTSNPSTDFEQRYNDLLRQQAHDVDWIKWKWLARDLLTALQERPAVETVGDRLDSIEQQLGAVVFRYIDRLNDQTVVDNADKIVREMLAEVNPLLDREFQRPALKASGCPTHGMEHFFEGMCIECGVVPPVGKSDDQ